MYAKNTLQVQEINQGIRDKQSQLRKSWFDQEKFKVEQFMNYNEVNG